MHKKLENDLMSLAHSLLRLKNKEDVFVLKEKAKEIYEKLSLLAFVEEYVNTTPNLQESKAELVETIEKAFETKKNAIIDKKIAEPIVALQPAIEAEKAPEIEETIIHNLSDEAKNTETETLEPTIDFEEKEIEIEEKKIEQPFDELEELMFTPIDTATNFKNDVKDVGERKTPTLEEELHDTLSVDVMANLFENALPKSLNDKLAGNIQIGLNDRIAFVKNLFNGKQEDYNRVISQLNTLRTEKEALNFINSMVKPDYNWSEFEDLETRFMDIIMRKYAS